jgi:signal transduction histidine kinase
LNRLWVRLSLAFTAVFLVAAAIAVLTVHFSTAGAQAALNPPPEVAAYFEQVRAQTRSGLPDQTLVLLGVAAVAIVAGVLMSRGLTAPLAELEQGAQAIGRRQLSERVTVRGSQEMVAVATAFNDMAAQLEQAETQRQALLGDVAHELRHPLHVLQGNLQAMLDGVYPRDDAELERLMDQTAHLAVLVNDLHVLAQAEAQRLPLYKRPVEVADLVKEVAAAYEPLAAAGGKSLRVELLGTMPAVLLDQARIRQALQNLLDNALRHTEAGGLITVRVVQDGRFVTLTVADDGAGIPAELLPLVFERMTRGDPARRRDADSAGAGLGLPITKAIVELHGGSVTVSSAGLGQGSVFGLRLPLGGG